MKTPKSWKSTKECIERIRQMGNSRQSIQVKLRQSSDDRWWWEIFISDWPRHNVRISDDEARCHKYQDEAANEAYRFAYKHLRRKRRKKAPKEEATS